MTCLESRVIMLGSCLAQVLTMCQSCVNVVLLIYLPEADQCATSADYE